ncbi:glycosyltransferase family 39 protein [Acidovorax sp. SUPP2522]|uniref:ArnT family glycosyltransferase n=1 Tax=unclassified Acidovorax TaxID=2684926 RepID=UPI00234901BE|nr:MULTISPECIES: glycosyltransferase family 39 protein [unclassified Acidovorax]WCM96637.1 glycosyltransferase family 39 protein [Acidovorax sp. GBBC 1281]GKT19262.1 glycosyltransferase family 39 protein [Acidovorax sp. SUPP2522]
MSDSIPESRPHPRELLTAGLVLFALLALTAWARPLMLPDEGRYAGVAWEMLRSGDWATPTLDGMPFFHKPPLFYWITAAAMSVFGVGEWSARAAPLAGAWLAGFGMFAFVWRWAGRRQARLVAMVLLAQPLFYIGGQFANLDMLVAGCITATILLAAHSVLCREAGLHGRLALVAAYAFAALGVLSKGLIGMVLPGMVIVVWMVLRGRMRGLLGMLSLPGLAAFLAIAAPWFVAMQMRFPEFFDYFFLEQHFRRFTGTQFNNAQPWWFYPALLLLFHSLWLPWIVRTLMPSRLATLRADSIRLLMGVWAFLIVGFFSLPHSKLVGYILPALAPLAYLLCEAFANAGQSPRKTMVHWWYGASIVAALMSLGAIAYLSLNPDNSNRALAQVLRSEHAAGEPVFMLERYHYDVALYARLLQPPVVVDAWNDPGIPRTDNWRKELADASRFAPEAAKNLLLLPERLPSALCLAPVSWVMGPPGRADSLPFLAHAKVVYRAKEVVLWRVERSQAQAVNSLRCEGMSNAG